jgi:serine phosphatase RsbU (regulator of sigma subunit)
MDIEKFINENTMLNEMPAQLFNKSRLIQLLDKYAQALQLQQTDVIKSVCEIEKEFEKCPLFKQYDNGCYGCKYRKQTVL